MTTIISLNLATAMVGALDNKRPGWPNLYVSLHTQLASVTEAVFRGGELQTGRHGSYERQSIVTSNGAAADASAFVDQTSALSVDEGVLSNLGSLSFAVENRDTQPGSADIIRAYGVWTRGPAVADDSADFLFGANLSAPVPASRGAALVLHPGTVVMKLRAG